MLAVIPIPGLIRNAILDEKNITCGKLVASDIVLKKLTHK